MICPKCGAHMKLREGLYGKFFGCQNYPRCRTSHGAHQKTGRPFGTPADDETRAARKRAHQKFDRLWKSGKMKRWEAYKYMAGIMKMTKDEAHIGKFNLEQCESLIEMIDF